MPHRVLMMEDEPGIRLLVSRTLGSAGYEVVALNDGQAGVDAVAKADIPYDLVITNNCMPHLSGAEVIWELRTRYPHLPILHLDDGSRPHSPPLPEDVINLRKPFRMEEILRSVAVLLNSRVEGSRNEH